MQCHTKLTKWRNRPYRSQWNIIKIRIQPRHKFLRGHFIDLEIMCVIIDYICDATDKVSGNITLYNYDYRLLLICQR